MNRRRMILWGLGAGQLLVAVMAYAASDWAANSWIEVASQVVVISQFYLAGIWVALGQRSAPWRLVAVGICLTSLTWLEVNRFFELQLTILVFSPGVLATIAALFIARGFGFCLRAEEGGPGMGHSSKLQFSLRSILVWTAVTAMLLGLVSFVHPDFARRADFFTWRELLSLFLPLHLLFVGICVAELAIVLQMRRPWIGLALLLPIALALSGLLGWVQWQRAEFVWAGVCIMVWFAISFMPLRLLGYRFGRWRSVEAEVGPSGAFEECPIQDPPDLAD